MYINMYQQNSSLLTFVLFQFDWHLSEPNKFGRGIKPYNILPFWAPFYIWEVPGYRFIFLTKSIGFGSTVRLLRFGPEAKHVFLFVTPKRIWRTALLRIYSIVCIFG